MESQSIVLNVLIYKDEEQNIYIAHCLEMDLVATADSREQVEKDIIDIIQAHITYAFESNNLENMYSPAPPEIWRRYYEHSAQIRANTNRIIHKSRNKNIFIPPKITANFSEDLCFA